MNWKRFFAMFTVGQLLVGPAAIAETRRDKIEDTDQYLAEPTVSLNINGMSASKIADTLDRLAKFVIRLNIGKATDALADGTFKRYAKEIRVAKTQEELDRLVLGEGDKGAYLPGRLGPTLQDVESLLKFLAAASRNAQIASEARGIVVDIEKFGGFGGGRHAAFLGHQGEIKRWILAQAPSLGCRGGFTPHRYDRFDAEAELYGARTITTKYSDDGNVVITVEMPRGNGDFGWLIPLPEAADALDQHIKERVSGQPFSLSWNIRQQSGHTYGDDKLTLNLTARGGDEMQVIGRLRIGEGDRSRNNAQEVRKHGPQPK